MYDTLKILRLLVLLVYVMAWLRATLHVERVRDYLAGKGQPYGGFMLIKVLGPGCARCDEARQLVEKLVREHGIDATVEKVADIKAIMALGVLATPAIVIDGKVLCTGRVPGADELLEWLRA